MEPVYLLAEGRLPIRIRTGSASGEAPSPGAPADGLRGAAQSAAGNAEKTLIEKALRETNGNRTLAARALDSRRPLALPPPPGAPTSRARPTRRGRATSWCSCRARRRR